MNGPTSSQTKPLATIDGQAIHIATMEELIKSTVARLKSGLGFTLYTLNMDHVVKRRMDPSFREAYRNATFVTADGAPLVWLARRQGVCLERTTGADLLAPLCAAAATERLPIAFFGSSADSLHTAARALRRQYAGIEIVHIEAPALGFDPASKEADAAGERIARSGARICFVALGAPKQELFSDRMARVHADIGYLGIGAALDFVSGAQTRAPQFFQNNGLEWAWRLGKNPVRLGSRYLRCAAVLADLILLKPMLRRAAGAVPPHSMER